MNKNLQKLLSGFQKFKEQYNTGDNSLMQKLAQEGQSPEIMVITCCDSRVDPAVLFQCDPGELFVIRNVANIVPPYEHDGKHHGTSAALEFGVCYLNVKQIIILGHSNCGGIQALLSQKPLHQDDFISSWVSLIETNNKIEITNPDHYAKQALKKSFKHCLEFPWIKERYENKTLEIHTWFFDITRCKLRIIN